MSKRKPVRWLGSARGGTSHFIRQRVTGIINAIFLLVAVVVLARNTGYQHLIFTLSNPLILAIALIGTFSAVYHMVIGMQVVIEDYVHHHVWRSALLLGNMLIGLLVVTLVAIGLIRLGLIA